MQAAAGGHLRTYGKHMLTRSSPAVPVKFYKKQLIAPWAQSLVPETCRGAAVLERLGEDSVRRAKADFPLVPLCPVKSMAPVLAIAGMVARAVDTTAL
jgi:hypothetical protein